MNEESVERLAERAMDRLDKRLMSGALTQAAYDAEVKKLDAVTEKCKRADGGLRQWFAGF